MSANQPELTQKYKCDKIFVCEISTKG